MKDFILKILILAGVPKDQADKIAAEMDKGDAFALTITDELKTAIRANQMALFENDDELLTKLKGPIESKFKDIFKRKLRQSFAMDLEATKDMDYMALIEHAVKVSGENKNKDVKTLQDENLALSQTIKDLKEVQIPQIQAQVDAERSSLKVRGMFEKIAKAHKYRNPFDFVFDSCLTTIGGKYDVKISEDGNSLEFYNKGTTVRAKTADGTAFIKAEDLWQNTADLGKFLSKSNAPDNDDEDEEEEGAGTGTGTPKPKIEKKVNEEEREAHNPHLKAAKEHLARVKEENAAQAAKNKKE